MRDQNEITVVSCSIGIHAEFVRQPELDLTHTPAGRCFYSYQLESGDTVFIGSKTETMATPPSVILMIPIRESMGWVVCLPDSPRSSPPRHSGREEDNHREKHIVALLAS